MPLAVDTLGGAAALLSTLAAAAAAALAAAGGAAAGIAGGGLNTTGVSRSIRWKSEQENRKGH